MAAIRSIATITATHRRLALLALASFLAMC
jgi:hypothetical protein